MTAPAWPKCPCPGPDPKTKVTATKGQRPVATRVCLCNHPIPAHNEDGVCSGPLDLKAPGMLDRALMAAMNAGGSDALFDLLRAIGWRDPVEYKADIAQVVREIVGLAMDHEDSARYAEWLGLCSDVTDGVYGPR